MFLSSSRRGATSIVSPVISHVMVSLALSLAVAAQAPMESGPGGVGPGIVQPTFTPQQIGKKIGTLEAEALGTQPTMADFQHGWLYMTSGRPNTQAQERHNWIDVSDPKEPEHMYAMNALGNKPHIITFWDHLFIHGGQDGALTIWDFFEGTEVGRHATGVRPVAYGPQPPYDFRGTNGYISQPNRLAITDFSDPANPIALISPPIDLGAVLGFKIGSVFPIGNVLVAAASEGLGVATFDISDPANPVLLHTFVPEDPEAQPIYTAALYGNPDPGPEEGKLRLYACETNYGIRVYDLGSRMNDYAIAEVGFLEMKPPLFPAGLNPRYVAIKEGVGYTAPGASQLVLFDADPSNLVPLAIHGLDGPSDFVFPLGNMAVLGGSALKNTAAIIAIEELPDELGPVPVFASPEDLESCVPITSRIGFSMSDHIDVTSLDPTTLVVRPVGPLEVDGVPGTFSTSHFGHVNFSPDVVLPGTNYRLLPNTTYEVVLPPGGIRDVVGNGLHEAYSSTFTTGPASDPLPGGLAHHWPFDGNATDEVGSSHGTIHATIGGGVAGDWGYVAGQVGQAFHFNGAVRVGVGTVDFGDTFTVSMWARVDASVTGQKTLIANTTGGANSDGFKLAFRGSDQRLRLVTGDGSTSDTAESIAGAMSLSTWHYVTAAVDATSGVATLYVDGFDVTEDALILTGFGRNRGTSIGGLTNNLLRFVGDLDEVRAYDDLLTPFEIAQLKGAGGLANTPPSITSVTATPASSVAPFAETGEQVMFAVTATDPDGTTLDYAFDFGDGTSSGYSPQPTASHTYLYPRRFNVIVRVTDGCSTVSQSLTQIVHAPLTPLAPTHSTTIVHDEGRQEVWCVNPDNDTVTVLDEDTLAKLDEISTAQGPRFLALRPAADELWVSCASDRLTIVDLTSLTTSEVVMPHGSNPAGIAFTPDGSRAFVVLEGSGTFAGFYDLDNRLFLTGAPSAADFRAVAVSADSSSFYLPVFITPFIGMTGDQGLVFEYSVQTFAPIDGFFLPFDNSPDGENSGSGVPNYLTDMVLSPDGSRAWIPAKKDNTGRGLGPGQSQEELTPDNTVRSILVQIDLQAGSENVEARRDVDDQGFASALAFSPVGDLVFVAYPLNNEVLVFDTATGNPLGGTKVGSQPDDIGSSPSGLAMRPDGKRLYVHNFLDRTVEALDVEVLVNGTGSVISSAGITTTVASENLSVQVLDGKRLFTHADDERMSEEGYMSCASCHLDGDHDGRVWDFTDREQGFRNTIDLRGHGGTAQGPVHWTGNFCDIQDFEIDIRGGLGGLGFLSRVMYPDPQPCQIASIATPELDAIAAYVSSLTETPTSPYRNVDGTLTASAVNGKVHFQALGCAACHSGPEFTDSAFGVAHNVGTAGLSSGPFSAFDTPTLKGAWRTPPYLHRGQAATLPQVFTVSNAPNGTPHADYRTLSEIEQAELIDYLLQIDNDGD